MAVAKTDLETKKQAIEECLKQYSLTRNSEINDSIISLDCFPSNSSKKLALLILTYKREATSQQLKMVSDQPAALIRDLRKDGFVFKNDDRNSSNFLYKNAKGEVCRKIIGFKLPKAEIKGKVKSILEKSVAACVSAIEIYNKPDFKYREETFSILLVNAWELLLKAKISAINNNAIQSIYAIDNNGKTKINRAGNPMTIDINSAMQRLFEAKFLDERCRASINLLVEIRDNAIHFVNKSIHFNKKVLEIGTASLSNYVTAIDDWFGKDLSQYNFYLMPISFFHLADLESHSILGQDVQSANLLRYFREIETQHPYDEDSNYSIALQVRTEFVKSTSENSVLEVRFTTREDAPEVRVSEESEILRRHPIAYNELLDKLRKRYVDFKQNDTFLILKRDLENQEKHKERYCKIRWLNVLEKKGTKQKFYSPEIIKEFDKHYTKRR